MNKKLIITISSIAAVILIVALICVVFIIGDIKVQTTSEMLLSEDEKLEIVSDSKIVKHSSIFALSEDIAKSNIEKENPYIKVVQIERKVPNKIIINVSSRVGIIAVPINEGGYWIIDRELKVLDRKANIDNELYAVTNGVVIPETTEIGDFLEGEDWIRSIINGIESCSFVGKRFGSFIKAITFNEDRTINLKTNTGVSMIVPYVEKDITKKIINREYQIYLKLTDEERSSGSIAIGDDDKFHHFM